MSPKVTPPLLKRPGRELKRTVAIGKVTRYFVDKQGNVHLIDIKKYAEKARKLGWKQVPDSLVHKFQKSNLTQKARLAKLNK